MPLVRASLDFYLLERKNLVLSLNQQTLKLGTRIHDMPTRKWLQHYCGSSQEVICGLISQMQALYFQDE